MIDFNLVLNTCFATTNELRVFAGYSHLIPVVLSLLLGFFIFFKSKFSLFSKIFFVFVFAISIWLIGDFIIWTSNNYYLVYSLWAPLLYVEIIFYTLGLYFIFVFVNKKDISFLQKILLFISTLIPFVLTLMGKSVTGFYHFWCEAGNNTFLDIYKLVYEAIILLIMLIYIVIPFIKKEAWKIKKTNLIVIGSMFLFLAIFGITEYIAATTGNYELNLYSLFLLPLFVLAIIYAIFELDIFNVKVLGTHYLVIGLMILAAGQFFFVEGSTDQLLTILTVLITASLGLILFRNLRKETQQRLHIEKLSELLKDSKNRLEEANLKLEFSNDKLQSLDKLKTEFLSLASHQLRSPLTSIQGYASMLAEGDFGKVSKKQKDALDRVYQSSKHLTLVVEDLLNVAKIEQGGMQYAMKPFDLSKVVSNIVKDFSVTATQKNIEFSFENDKNTNYQVNGDMEKIRQVVLNFIDNAIKYTKKGKIISKLFKDSENNIIFSVEDTGMGITPEVIDSLFVKFSRGNGGKMNTSGSGLGLYLAKEIIEAHKGKVWAESPGKDLGSTFFMQLKAIE